MLRGWRGMECHLWQHGSIGLVGQGMIGTPAGVEASSAVADRGRVTGLRTGAAKRAIAADASTFDRLDAAQRRSRTARASELATFCLCVSEATPHRCIRDSSAGRPEHCISSHHPSNVSPLRSTLLRSML